MQKGRTAHDRVDRAGRDGSEQVATVANWHCQLGKRYVVYCGVPALHSILICLNSPPW